MSYLYLAVKYLIHDKKRTIQTILGVTLVAIFLYSGLWAFLSVNDFISPEFHVAIRSTDPDLVRDLIRDRSVHTVEVGKTEGIAQAARLSGSSEELKPWSEEAVILVRLHRLPKMKKFSERIRNEYGVEAVWNQKLYQKYDEEGRYMFLISVLICYLVAIPAVAIVRNALQLSTLEQIRDYGNLRCIGATQKQLKGILYLQGALEVGVALLLALMLSLILTGGLNRLIRSFVVLNTLGSPESTVYQIKVLPLPLLFVTFAFFFDLYFMLNENLKSVYGMSPTEAITGQYRFINKKIRPSRAQFIRELFGIEGEYAYKNLMRNPFRVWKNVGILSITMAFITAVLMAMGGHFNTLSVILGQQTAYYQICMDPGAATNPSWTYLRDREPERSFQASSPITFDTESIRAFSQNRLITEIQNGYQAHLVTSVSISEHLDPDLLGQTFAHKLFRSDEEFSGAENLPLHNSWEFRAFSEKEKEAYGEKLLEGTMDVSKQGIVLINGALARYNGENYDLTNLPHLFEHLTDLKIGDEIRVPDPVWMEEQKNEWIRSTLSDEALLIELYRKEHPAEDPSKTAITKNETYDFLLFQRKLCLEEYRSWYEEAMEKGNYRTYRIEGILKEDPLYQKVYETPILLMPLNEYLELTGTDEDTGFNTVNFHVSHPFLFSMNYLGRSLLLTVDPRGNLRELAAADYTLEIREWCTKFIQASYRYLIFFIVLLVFLFITFINIRNATRNSFFLRKKEFAQLYVIGCTRKTLIRMMRYEGLISGLISVAIGAVLSFPSVFLLKIDYYQITATPIQWWLYPPALLLAAIPVISFYALSVGSQAKKMKIDPAEDLIESGE